MYVLGWQNDVVMMHSRPSCNYKTFSRSVNLNVVCFSDTLFWPVLLPLFLLLLAETDLVSQHFSLFLFYCIHTGKKLDFCTVNHTSDTVTTGNFERENLHKFQGLASICESFSVNFGGVVSFWEHKWAIRDSFLCKIRIPPICKSFFPQKFPAIQYLYMVLLTRSWWAAFD